MYLNHYRLTKNIIIIINNAVPGTFPPFSLLLLLFPLFKMLKKRNKIWCLRFSKSQLVENISEYLFSKTSRQMSAQQLQSPLHRSLRIDRRRHWKIVPVAKRQECSNEFWVEMFLLRNVTNNSGLNNAQCTRNNTTYSKVQPVYRCEIVTRAQNAMQLSTGELCLWDTNVHYFVSTYVWSTFTDPFFPRPILIFLETYTYGTVLRYSVFRLQITVSDLTLFISLHKGMFSSLCDVDMLYRGTHRLYPYV
jgi:hypothetical protein